MDSCFDCSVVLTNLGPLHLYMNLKLVYKFLRKY